MIRLCESTVWGMASVIDRQILAGAMPSLRQHPAYRFFLSMSLDHSQARVILWMKMATLNSLFRRKLFLLQNGTAANKRGFGAALTWGPLELLVSAFLLSNVFIQKLPDHFLILHVMLSCGFLEESNTLRTERYSYLRLLIFQRQIFRRRKKIRHQLHFTKRFISVLSLLAHRPSYPFASSPHQICGYDLTDR